MKAISKCAYAVIDFYSTHALLIVGIKMNVMPWDQSAARNFEFKLFVFVFVLVCLYSMMISAGYKICSDYFVFEIRPIISISINKMIYFTCMMFFFLVYRLMERITCFQQI